MGFVPCLSVWTLFPTASWTQFFSLFVATPAGRAGMLWAWRGGNADGHHKQGTVLINEPQHDSGCEPCPYTHWSLRDLLLLLMQRWKTMAVLRHLCQRSKPSHQCRSCRHLDCPKPGKDNLHCLNYRPTQRVRKQHSHAQVFTNYALQLYVICRF